MFSPLTLMQLPDDNKLQILEQCDLKSILTLRKTCHDFRNLIDDKKPDGKIESINILSSPHCIFFTVFDQNEVMLQLEYRHDVEGCMVVKNEFPSDKKFLLQGQNYLDIFFQDFEIIMNHQRKVLPTMSLRLSGFDRENEFFQNLQNYFKNRKTPMKVKSLTFFLYMQSQIVQYLSFFDHECLQNIEIRFIDSNELSEELVNSDQWKNASSAVLHNFNMRMMEHCMHFKEITVHCDGTVRDARDIPAFKEKMHESSHLKEMTMFIQSQIGSTVLINDGQPFRH